jgi:hypothetical protein
MLAFLSLLMPFVEIFVLFRFLKFWLIFSLVRWNSIRKGIGGKTMDSYLYFFIFFSFFLFFFKKMASLKFYCYIGHPAAAGKNISWTIGRKYCSFSCIFGGCCFRYLPDAYTGPRHRRPIPLSKCCC